MTKPTSNKKQQLKALLAKPHGARISVIEKKLGWQPHTIRAAISRLRKEGRSKVAKTGEAIYVIAHKAEVDPTLVAADAKVS